MKKVLKVMDSTGDSRVEFEIVPDAAMQSKAEAEARALFEKFQNKRAKVFAVNRGEGLPDKVVNKFDELEAENVIVPAIVGG